MIKLINTFLIILILSGCAKQVPPQTYMPTPPEILMRAPKELNTIRQNVDREETPDEEV